MKKNNRFMIIAALLAVTAGGAVRAADGDSFPPFAAFSDIVDHALFTPARHAADSGRGGDPGAPPVAGALRLNGIVAGEKGRTIALVFDTERGGESRVATGAVINGWRVESIDPQGMLLVAGSERRRIKLKQSIPPLR